MTTWCACISEILSTFDEHCLPAHLGKPVVVMNTSIAWEISILRCIACSVSCGVRRFWVISFDLGLTFHFSHVTMQLFSFLTFFSILIRSHLVGQCEWAEWAPHLYEYIDKSCLLSMSGATRGFGGGDRGGRRKRGVVLFFIYGARSESIIQPAVGFERLCDPNSVHDALVLFWSFKTIIIEWSKTGRRCRTL